MENAWMCIAEGFLWRPNNAYSAMKDIPTMRLQKSAPTGTAQSSTMESV